MGVMINVLKLDQEFRAAGIPIHGCNSDGEIAFADEATAAHRKKAEKILADHDASDTREQRLAKIGMQPFYAAVLLVLGDPNPPADAQALIAEAAGRVRAVW